jgi:hypothetical protein
MITQTTLRITFIVLVVLAVLVQWELPLPSLPLTTKSRPVISLTFSLKPSRSSILVLPKWSDMEAVVVVVDATVEAASAEAEVDEVVVAVGDH